MNINETYEHLQFKHPETPFILHSFSFEAGRSPVHYNWHESIEILHFTAGCAEVAYNFQKIKVNAGDTVVVNSNTLHHICAVTQTHYYCLIIDRAFCVANYMDTSVLQFEPLVHDREIGALIEQFVKEHRDKTQTCRPQLLRSTALRILARLKAGYSREESESPTDTSVFLGVKAALEYIHAQSHTKITLDDLARFSGVSKFYLAREFRRLVGYTVVEYVNRVRCENAKRMLCESRMSVAAIGLSCGYPNASYFNEVFLRIVGISPGRYREQAFAGE